MLKKLSDKFGDKTLHIWAGILITVISGLLLYKFIDSNFLVFPTFGFVIGNLAGLAKEFIWDKWMKKGTFNWEDMLATLWGTCVGFAIVVMSIGTYENLGTN